MNFRKIRLKKLSNNQLLGKFFNCNFAELIQLKIDFLDGSRYVPKEYV